MANKILIIGVGGAGSIMADKAMKDYPELYEHEYCSSERGCTGCGRTSCIHYDIEFRLLSYEIEE